MMTRSSFEMKVTTGSETVKWNSLSSWDAARFLTFLAVLALPLLSSWPVIAQTPPGVSVDVISSDEVQRGQKGYGLSVFAGSEPERFDVEVIGVLRNPMPELTHILARLSGQDLERIGVVAGMSGSPVYIDGRLAGAVSFGYSFGLDAIAGIMPISAMRKLNGLPVIEEDSARRPASTFPFDPELLLQRELPLDLLTSALERLRSPLIQGGRSTALWSASGFGDDANRLLQQAVGPLAPMSGSQPFGLQTGSGGGGDVVDIGDLVPGSAVAGVLVQGDLSLAIHGTVTDRQGDEILAFGHPVFASGPGSMPMGLSEVVTIIGNQVNSFKVSNAGRVVGAFDQDRQAGVHGRLGLEAPTFPLRISVHGLAEAVYDMEVAAIPDLAPSLVAIAALGAVNSSSYSAGVQGLDLSARIAFADYEDLVIRQAFDGDQAVLQSVIYLLGLMQFLQLNDFEKATLESLEIGYDQSARPRQATLLAAHPARIRVRAGETVPITLDLQPYRGPQFRHTVRYRIPENAAEGRLVLLLGDGSSMDAARLSVEPRTPETLEQALSLLRSYHSRGDLLFFAIRPGAGLAIGGEVLPDLPPSMLSIFGSGGGEVGQPLSMSIFGEQQESLDWPLEGLLRIDFEIERDPS